MRNFVFLLIVSILLGIVSASPEAIELEIPLGARTIKIDDPSLIENYSGFSTDQRRFLAPYMVEYALKINTPIYRNSLINAFRKDPDPVVGVYATVLRALSASSRLEDRLRILSGHPVRGNSEIQMLIRYYRALFSYGMNNDDGKTYSDLLLSCNMNHMQSACNLAQLVREVNRVSLAGNVGERDYQKILELMKPYLSRRQIRPPFMTYGGRHIPDRLVSLGLPLEAAIFTERVVYNDETELAGRMRFRIPLYLAAAADFRSAVRYSNRYHPSEMPEILNARLDWMILSQNYRGAIDLLSHHGPVNLTGSRMAGMTDYWTGFSYSPGVASIKLALLLYLAGDEKGALGVLDKLADIPGNDDRGAPYKHSVRLRMAQVLLLSNTDLAQKIAEDISYISQEKGWVELEYQATVMDGWARYYQKNYYKSLVNFIKARGIYYSIKERDHISPYSRLLGFLSVKRKMNAMGDYSAVIEGIEKLLSREPYNRAIYTILKWAPAHADNDYFREEAVSNYIDRGHHWSALNLLVSGAQRDGVMFPVGRNPGGMRGLSTSAFWLDKLRNFSYIKKGGIFGLPSLDDSAETLDRQHRSMAGKHTLSPGDFGNEKYVLINYSVGDGRMFFLIHPGSTSSIAYLKVDHSVLEQVVKNCNHHGGDGCDRYRSSFSLLRKYVKGGADFDILYTPEMDIPYEKLLASSDAHASYFYQPVAVSDSRGGALPVSYMPEGCETPSPFSTTAPVRGFSTLFGDGGASLGGLWFWPGKVDTRKTRSGADRPVYLRNFQCTNENLLFWNMERYGATDKVEGVLYRARDDDAVLDEAFVKYFAERNSVLMELGPDWKGDVPEEFHNVLKNNYSRGKLAAYRSASRAVRDSHGPDAVRVILPGWIRQ